MKQNLDEELLREAQIIMLKIMKDFDRVCRENNIPYWLDSGTLLGAVRHKGFIPWDDDVDICMLREDYERFNKIAPSLLSKDLFVQNFDTDSDSLWQWTKIRDNNSYIVTSHRYDMPLFHQGICIDLFPVDRLPNRKLINWIWRYLFCTFYKFFKTIQRYRQSNYKYPIFHYHHIFRNLRRLLVKTLCRRFRFLNMKIPASIENKFRKYATVQPGKNSDFLIAKGIGLPWDKTYSYNWIFPLKELLFEDAMFFVPFNYHEYLTVMYGDYMKIPEENARSQHHLIIRVSK